MRMVTGIVYRAARGWSLITSLQKKKGVCVCGGGGGGVGGFSHIEGGGGCTNRIFWEGILTQALEVLAMLKWGIQKRSVL